MVRYVVVGLGIATLLILNSPAIGEPDRTEAHAINLLRGIQTATRAPRVRDGRCQETSRALE